MSILDGMSEEEKRDFAEGAQEFIRAHLAQAEAEHWNMADVLNAICERDRDGDK